MIHGVASDRFNWCGRFRNPRWHRDHPFSTGPGLCDADETVYGLGRINCPACIQALSGNMHCRSCRCLRPMKAVCCVAPWCSDYLSDTDARALDARKSVSVTICPACHSMPDGKRCWRHPEEKK